MESILLLRLFHLLGAAVLFGTGAGIAFFMWMAHRSGDARFVANTARVVVVADLVFTATAVVLQPVTGVMLAHAVGWPLTQGWLLLSIGLYVLTGLLWLPVVWIQLRLRDLAVAAARQETALPEAYRRLFRIWFWAGVPAFIAVLCIYALMVFKPQLQLLASSP